MLITSKHVKFTWISNFVFITFKHQCQYYIKKLITEAGILHATQSHVIFSFYTASFRLFLFLLKKQLSLLSPFALPFVDITLSSKENKFQYDGIKSVRFILQSHFYVNEKR